MPTYKFQIGQTVFLSPSLSIPGGAYIVTKKLPEHNGELEYRVKSANELHERVVRSEEIICYYQRWVVHVDVGQID